MDIIVNSGKMAENGKAMGQVSDTRVNGKGYPLKLYIPKRTENTFSVISFKLSCMLADSLAPVSKNTLRFMAQLFGMQGNEIEEMFLTKSPVKEMLSLLQTNGHVTDISQLIPIFKLLKLIEAQEIVHKFFYQKENQSKESLYQHRTKYNSKENQELFLQMEIASWDHIQEEYKRLQDNVGGVDVSPIESIDEISTGELDSPISSAKFCDQLGTSDSGVFSSEFDSFYFENKNMCSPATSLPGKARDHGESTSGKMLQRGRMDSGLGTFSSGMYSAVQEISVPSSGFNQEESCSRFSAEAFVNERGGTLSILGTKIHLHVPPGALPPEKATVISISIIDNMSLRMRASGGRGPSLTPVIKCEPHGIEFLKPVELIIPHCGQICDPDRCDVKIHYSPYSKDGGTDWTPDLRNTNTQSSAAAVYKLRKQTCTLFLYHFCLIDLTFGGESIQGKKLRVVPIANRIEDVNDNVVMSLWFCDDLDSEYKCLMHDERDDHKRLPLDTYNTFILFNTGWSVRASVQDQDQNWPISNPSEELDFNQIWHCSRGKCSFKFINTTGGKSKLETELWIQQLGDGMKVIKFFLDVKVKTLLNADPPRERYIEASKDMMVFVSPPHSIQTQPETVSHRPQEHLEGLVSLPCFEGPRPGMLSRSISYSYGVPKTEHPFERQIGLSRSRLQHSSGPSTFSAQRDAVNSTFSVPYELATILCRTLQPETPSFNNWKLLAEKLEFPSKEISYRTTLSDPTITLLEDACNSGRLSSYQQLIVILTDINRKDAVSDVKTYLKEKRISVPEIGFDCDTDSGCDDFQISPLPLSVSSNRIFADDASQYHPITSLDDSLQSLIIRDHSNEYSLHQTKGQQEGSFQRQDNKEQYCHRQAMFERNAELRQSGSQAFDVSNQVSSHEHTITSRKNEIQDSFREVNSISNGLSQQQKSFCDRADSPLDCHVDWKFGNTRLSQETIVSPNVSSTNQVKIPQDLDVYSPIRSTDESPASRRVAGPQYPLRQYPLRDCSEFNLT